MTDAQIGDRIIVCNSNGTFDLEKIDETGQRVKVRDSLKMSMREVWEIARGSLTGNNIWVSDESTPDVLRRY